MADHSQNSLAIVDVDHHTEDTKNQSYVAIDGSVGTGAGGGGGTVTTWFMCGHDSSCANGAPLHTWTSSPNPDFAGASAGALPCGGPLVDIAVCGSVEV